MRDVSNFARRAGKAFLLGALFVCRQGQAQPITPTNVTVRVMAANLTSGDDQDYQPPGIRIFQGLKPDVVAIQEFAYNNSSSSNNLRALVNTAFGTNFVFFCETNSPAYSIPNGVISRWPFVTNGSWIDSDAGVNDRGFAWAQIDVPGTNDLYVVSVHLKASNSGSDVSRRAAEAAEVKALISTNFPANAWIIVAGDFNIFSESEGAVTTLNSFVSDKPVPADLNGDADTNAGRDERYDRVYASFSLTNLLTPLILPSHTLTNGLVFVSTDYTPLADVPPVQFSDSNAQNMQHHAVVKDFKITYYVTNSGVAPVITNAPQNLSIAQGSNANFTVVAGGTAPLNYQWRFSTTNIAGATASSYTRSNAQPAHAGNYFVVITNIAGAVTSSPGVLTVIVPPAITTQPTNQTVAQGATAVFQVAATGSPTPAFQWRFHATNLAGATTSNFTRNNAQPADIGNYSVIVTNEAGSLTSAMATLKLIVPSPSLAMPAATTLQFQGLSNLVYTVQVKTNVNDTNWTFAGTAVSPTGIIFFTNTATAPQQFYRVVYP